MHREQIALRFPLGTKSRLQAVAQPHESLTATILRAIEALEQHPQELPSDATERRLAEMEQRLSAIERRQPQGGIQGHLATSRQGADARKASRPIYPDEAKRLAVELAAKGIKNPQIRDQLLERFGASPKINNLPKRLVTWAKQLESEGSTRCSVSDRPGALDVDQEIGRVDNREGV